MDSSRCADLIEKIALDRDKASFTTLFDHYAPRLKTYAERTGCRDDEAEALAQETLLSVWRNAAGFDRAKADASTWLFTIMRNKRIDLARRTRQANVLYDENEETRTGEGDSFQPTRRAELLREALRRLSKEQREMLGLAFFGAETYQDVAQRLEIPLATVDSRIRLALERLRSATDVVRVTQA